MLVLLGVQSSSYVDIRTSQKKLRGKNLFQAISPLGLSERERERNERREIEERERERTERREQGPGIRGRCMGRERERKCIPFLPWPPHLSQVRERGGERGREMLSKVATHADIICRYSKRPPSRLVVGNRRRRSWRRKRRMGRRRRRIRTRRRRKRTRGGRGLFIHDEALHLVLVPSKLPRCRR
jgi:hypothetical protein